MLGCAVVQDWPQCEAASRHGAVRTAPWENEFSCRYANFRGAGKKSTSARLRNPARCACDPRKTKSPPGDGYPSRPPKKSRCRLLLSGYEGELVRTHHLAMQCAGDE